MPKRLDKEKFLQAKIKGLNNTEAALAAGSTEKGAKQAGWRLSTNMEGEQSRMVALKKYDITWDLLIAKLTVMINAEKQDNYTGELKPDYGTQLSATKELIKMLSERKQEELTPQPTFTIPTNATPIEAQRILFKT